MTGFRDCQNFQYSELEEIRSISFTRREIDIITCILGGRTSKKIASFLEISPKTVENHIRNIMLKIGGNSRENIIDFVEKSGKFEFAKVHYTTLLKNIFFEQLLHEASLLLRKDTLAHVVMIYPKQKNKNSLLYPLERHFRRAGIRIVAETVELVSPHTLNNSVSKHYIYCIDDQILEKMQANEQTETLEITKLIQKAKQDPSFHIFVLLNRKPFTDILSSLSSMNYIDIDDEENYYFAVFKILKKLHPNSHLDTLISKFQSYDVGVHTSSLNVFHTRAEREPFKNLKQINHWIFFGLGIASIVLFFMLFSRHSIENTMLLKEAAKVDQLWMQIYEPLCSQSTSQAEFYQLRGNVLSIDRARKISEKVEKMTHEINRNLENIKGKREFINMNLWVLSPLNWSLKNKIFNKLEKHERALLISLSFNTASKHMAKEDFVGVTTVLNDQTIPLLKREIEIVKFDDQKRFFFRKLMAIAININGVAKRKLAEDQEKDKHIYKKILNEICTELSESIENYDPSNLNTYIIMHFIKLILAQEEPDVEIKKRLDVEAEYYLDQASERDPKEPSVLSAQALHYMEKEEYDRASIAFNLAIKNDPYNIGVLHNRSKMYLKLGEKHDSVVHYQKAYEDIIKANELKPNDCMLIKLLVWSSLYIEGCKKATYKFQKIYKPLCMDGRRKWDNVSTMRDESAIQLEKKLNSKCHKSFY